MRSTTIFHDGIHIERINQYRFISDQFSRGICEIISDNNIRTHFLSPTHDITRQPDTTKNQEFFAFEFFHISSMIPAMSCALKRW